MLFKFSRKKIKAAAAITTVLIFSSMLLLSGITLVASNIDLVYLTSDYSNNIITEIGVFSCSEEVLRKVKDDRDLVGDFSFNLDEVVCEANLSSQSATLKRVELSLTNGSYTKIETFFIDISGAVLATQKEV